MTESQRRLSAVFFADVVGFTELTSKDEAAAMRVIDVLQRISHRIVEKTYHGRVVKFIGDATLAEFFSVDAAVRAALAMQEEFAVAAKPFGVSGLLRIAVHLGEVIASPDGDIYGDGVNTASRLQTHAEPGHVLVSEDVWRQLRARRFFQFNSLGELELRGISVRVGVFDVVAGSSDDAPIDFPAQAASHSNTFVPINQKRRLQKQAGWTALGALVIIAGVLFAMPRMRAEPVAPFSNGQPLIAVLSLESENAQAAHKDFAAGFEEALQGELGASNRIMVATSSITTSYQGRRDALHALTRDVGITAVLQATTRWSGKRLRMLATLVEAPTGRVIWTQSFERTVTDDFDVQGELARSVAHAVEQKLVPDNVSAPLAQNDSVAKTQSAVPEPGKPAATGNQGGPVPAGSARESSSKSASREVKPELDAERLTADLRTTLDAFATAFAKGDTKRLKKLFPAANPGDLAMPEEMPPGPDVTAEIGSLQIRTLDPAGTVVFLVIVFRSGEPAVSLPLPYRADLVH